MSRKPSPLTPELLVRKQPTPANQEPQNPDALKDLDPETLAAVEQMVKAKMRKGDRGSKALTLKVDHDDYLRLNRARFELSMTAQEILYEALIDWLRKNKL